MAVATAALFDEEVDHEPEFNIVEAEPVEVGVKANELFKDVRALATTYIDEFFAGKMFYCGGPIPKRFLHDPQRVTMVINYNIIKGVDRAYSALKNTITRDDIDEAKRTGDSTSDVKLVNETLKMLSRSSIPQQFAGGMMVMYLELVEGVDFS